MSDHEPSEVSKERCTTPVKMIVLGDNDIEHNEIKIEIKEETELFQCTEETETHSFTCVEHVKAEKSEYEEHMQEVVLEDMFNIESQGLIDHEDMKYEVLEEAIDVEEHELFYEEDGQHEELEGVECFRAEGAVSAKKYNETQPKNIYTLAPGGENNQKESRTYRKVTEESSSKIISTRRLRTTKTIEINSEVTRNTSTYTAMDRGHDNICTDTNKGVDNSISSHTMCIFNDSDNHLIESSRERFCRSKKRHCRTCVVNEQPGKKRRKIHECEVCHRQFNYACLLKIHVTKHTGERAFKCQICQRRFHYPGSLRTHLSTHPGEKPFECKICKLRFEHTHSLNAHIKTHSGEKRYECEICKCRFKYMCHLKYHLRTHTGEKPFECEICQRKFGRAYSIKIHMKTHTGEKSTSTGEKFVECDICHVTFDRKDSLKTHLRTHTGEKPFECEICKVRLKQKATLKKHLRKHTAEMYGYVINVS